MNSVLNPEAPEFYPHLTSVTQVREPARRQSGYSKVNKTIKSSNSMPMGLSYNLFKTFTDFNVVTYQISENILEQSNQIIVKEMPVVKLTRDDEEFDTELLTDLNDTVLDRVDINIDTVTGAHTPNDKLFNEVHTKREQANVAPWNNEPIIAKIQMGSARFIGAKNIPRPQLTFKDTIDNSESLWVPKISDKPNNIKPLALNILYNDDGVAVGYEHPYSVELDFYQPPAQFIDPDPEPPSFPPSLEDTPLTYVATEAQLDALVEHLCSVSELAVDVEHHSYRTYQGITCLLQISTKEGGDFIIDTLAIREHIYKLNLIFTDPKKIKVFHGAESDVLWLQRDFGVYIVGLFDTHRAAKALNLSGLSLKYLLMKYCEVDADKTYRLADWRMRPLPDVLIKYARMDTHYLLYVWRVMKGELIEAAAGQLHLLLSVFEESRHICGTTYNKEVIHDTSHNSIFPHADKVFNTQQLAALKMLYKWRDSQARLLDESPTYLIPNQMMVSLADHLPREVQGVHACCDPMPPFVKQNILNIHRMILSCRQLPIQRHLYQRNAVETEIVNESPQEPIHAHNLHDLSQFPDFSEEQYINLEHAAEIVSESDELQPDIKLFKPAQKETYDGIVSDLNAEAELFFPPYDRYIMYRSLAQSEEIKEMKEKEARIAALGEGNELIITEVLEKLQAQTQNDNETQTDTVDKNTEQVIIVNETKTDKVDKDTEQEIIVIEDDNSENLDAEKKTAQRKRKISAEKVEQKETPEIVEITKKDNLPKAAKKIEGNLKPYPYKNADYKKFYDDSNNHKQTKTRLKKHKK